VNWKRKKGEEHIYMYIYISWGQEREYGKKIQNLFATYSREYDEHTQKYGMPNGR
jgi:hypothetical protein